MSLLSLDDVSIAFGHRLLLDQANLRIPRQQIVARRIGRFLAHHPQPRVLGPGRASHGAAARKRLEIMAESPRVVQ